MNETTSLAEMEATSRLSNLNRREHLLKIIRGKSDWKFYTSGTLWLIFAVYFCKEQVYLLLLLIALSSIIFGVYEHFSRRINALIELIGEENLRKPKTNDKGQNA